MTEGESLERIEHKMDEVIIRLERIDTKQTLQHEVVVDHEGRLRVIEGNRWPLPQIATLMALASVIVAALNWRGQ